MAKQATCTWFAVTNWKGNGYTPFHGRSYLNSFQFCIKGDRDRALQLCAKGQGEKEKIGSPARWKSGSEAGGWRTARPSPFEKVCARPLSKISPFPRGEPRRKRPLYSRFRGEAGETALMACKHTSETELSRPQARPGHFVTGTHAPRVCTYSACEARSGGGKKPAATEQRLSPWRLSVRAESTHKKRTGYRIKAIPLGLRVIPILGPVQDDIRRQRYKDRTCPED